MFEASQCERILKRVLIKVCRGLSGPPALMRVPPVDASVSSPYEFLTEIGSVHDYLANGPSISVGCDSPDTYRLAIN